MKAVFNVLEMIMEVSHNRKRYTATKMANGYTWQLVSVDNQREKITMNRQQLELAGILKQLEKNDD